MLTVRSAFSCQTPVHITVCGSLRASHLSYLEDMIAMAEGSHVKVGLNLDRISDIDVEAVRYLAGGEGLRFRIEACPSILREWIEHERVELGELPVWTAFARVNDANGYLGSAIRTPVLWPAAPLSPRP